MTARRVSSHGFTALGPMQEAFARLQGWRAHVMAIFLGAISALAFAPFHFSLILAFSFTGLIWMIDGARGSAKWGKVVFARGWAFGFGFFLVSLHWIAFAFLVEPEKHAIFLPLPLILLPAGLGLLWGAGAFLAGAFWSASPSRIFVFAIFFSIAEFVRGTLFGGFPWNLPGTTWTPGGPLSQAASIGGIYWLTLMTVFVMSTPAALVDTRETNSVGQRVIPAVLAVVLVGLGWTWGAQRISEPTTVYRQYVSLMDAGLPQDKKWEIPPAQVLRRYLELLDHGQQADSDVVIWPESAIPVAVLQDPNALDPIASFIGERKLILGTPRSERIRSPQTGEVISTADPNARNWFNSLAVIDKTSANTGQPLALYDKHRLVPFGELSATSIIPFGTQLRGFLPETLQQAVPSGFQPGPGPEIVYPGKDSGVRPFNALICYEGLFPGIPRHRNARPRADWMVVISNDAWFGRGMGPAQHYAQNRYRAIETGLPIARVASRGVTSMVDGLGREVDRGGVVPGDPEGWRSSMVRTHLPVAEAPTLYFRRGNLFFGLNFILFSLLAFLSWRR
ncbi:MAG: apolipoprotein N-acyltransferase [Hyphomonadaceae bacterium]